MADKDDIIREQREHIISLRKAIAILDIRLARLEHRARSADANIRRNAIDIDNLKTRLRSE